MSLRPVDVFGWGKGFRIVSFNLGFLNLKKKRPVGVIIFGLILIVTSIDQLRYIPTYSDYQSINHEWPQIVIQVRFVVSYLLRLAGLASGIGVLCLWDSFRKFLIWLSVFSVATVWLRHTYSAQFFYSEPIYRLRGSMFSLETFVWIAVVVHWMIDGFFSLFVILYFTRPYVIKIFIKETSLKKERHL